MTEIDDSSGVKWSDDQIPRPSAVDWAIAQGVEFEEPDQVAGPAGGVAPYHRSTDGGALRPTGWVMLLGGCAAILYGFMADASARGLGDFVNFDKLSQKHMAVTAGAALLVAGVVCVASAAIIDAINCRPIARSKD